MSKVSESDRSPHYSASQDLLLRIVKLMASDLMRVWSAQDLAAELGDASRNQVHRALANLAAHDWVVPAPGGWRLGPGVTRLAEQVRLAVADLHNHYLGDCTGERDD